MTKLSPEGFAGIHAHLNDEFSTVDDMASCVWNLLDHIEAQDTEIATLIQQVRNQTTELEDTRAAAQLAQRHLAAHRLGQGTYGGSYSYQHGPIEPGPLTTEELAQTEDD